MKQGKRVTGGSSLRFNQEVGEFLAIPEAERGKVHTAYTAIGVDDFNYGIHAYAIVSCLMGPGIQSAQYLGSSNQKQLMLQWADGRVVLMTIGKTAWLPFSVTVVTDKNIRQLTGDTTRIYRSLLMAVLPYLTGKTDKAPLGVNEILEPELAAMAARVSWLNNGQKVFLTDLRSDDPGYDGDQFALEYRRARMG